MSITLSFVPTRVVLKCKPYIHHHHLFVPLMSVQSALERLRARTKRHDTRCIGCSPNNGPPGSPGSSSTGRSGGSASLFDIQPRRRISCPWHPRFPQRVISKHPPPIDLGHARNKAISIPGPIADSSHCTVGCWRASFRSKGPTFPSSGGLYKSTHLAIISATCLPLR
jgi:hypothetical protein